MAATNVEVSESNSASASQSLKKGAEYEIARRKKIIIIVIIIVVVILIIGEPFISFVVVCLCFLFFLSDLLLFTPPPTHKLEPSSDGHAQQDHLRENASRKSQIIKTENNSTTKTKGVRRCATLSQYYYHC